MKMVALFRVFITLITVCAALDSSPVGAQATPSSVDCAEARDPVRCLARADAIAACADLHGTPKRDCLLTRLPPPDCKAAPNPARCELEQAARESCKSKFGKALSDCLRENGIESPKKSKTKQKPAAQPKSKTSSPTQPES